MQLFPLTLLYRPWSPADSNPWISPESSPFSPQPRPVSITLLPEMNRNHREEQMKDEHQSQDSRDPQERRNEIGLQFAFLIGRTGCQRKRLSEFCADTCESGKRGLIRSSEPEGKQVNFRGLSEKIVWWLPNKNKLYKGRRLCRSTCSTLKVHTSLPPEPTRHHTQENPDPLSLWFPRSQTVKYFWLVDLWPHLQRLIFCLYKIKAPLNNMDMNEYRCVPIKFYLQN